MAAMTTLRVRSDALAPGMILREVTELSIEYATLDSTRLKFLQTYFAGAVAMVATEMGHRQVPVAELEEKDSLQAIVDIPETLKIATVVQGLNQFMEKHGLMEFKVSAPANTAHPAPRGGKEQLAQDPKGMAPGSDAAKQVSKAKVVEVHRFLETVEKASQNRAKATDIVSEMLDRGRVGDYSSQGVEQVVDEILKERAAPAMRAIAGLRGSDQTYAHCTDMSVILAECYTDVMSRLGKEASELNKRFVLIAGFMHDIGKSEVPKEILESTKRFAPDSNEMQMMRNHTTYGARILEEMGMHKVTINVAHYHHVKKDNTLFTSYPNVPFSEVLPITRLASVVDVYQALIGKRKYKANWVPAKAVEYVMNLKGSEFDESMIGNFVESMGVYPVGSLVRLSTNELAFVLMIAPKDHPGRPIVAVVENAKGELLSHHTIMDLMLEPDIQVESVVDHYAHYNKSEEQAYQIFQSIRPPK